MSEKKKKVYALNEDDLGNVAGGAWYSDLPCGGINCPQCGQHWTSFEELKNTGYDEFEVLTCPEGHQWVFTG